MVFGFRFGVVVVVWSGVEEVPFTNRNFRIPQDAQVHHAIGLPFFAVFVPLGSTHPVFFFSLTQYVSIFKGNIFL